MHEIEYTSPIEYTPPPPPPLAYPRGQHRKPSPSSATAKKCVTSNHPPAPSPLRRRPASDRTNHTARRNMPYQSPTQKTKGFLIVGEGGGQGTGDEMPTSTNRNRRFNGTTRSKHKKAGPMLSSCDGHVGDTNHFCVLRVYPTAYGRQKKDRFDINMKTKRSSY